MQLESVIWVKARNISKHSISKLQKCGTYREKIRVLVEDRSRRHNKQRQAMKKERELVEEKHN